MNGFDKADTSDPATGSSGGTVSTVSVEQVPGAVVIRAGGEIDMTTAPAFESAVRECLAQGPATMIIDLSEASFFSSAGIAVVMFAHRSRADVAVRVIASDRTVLRPLELTGLTDDLAIYPDLASALDQ